ncbi:Cl- channel voltage-gated family protein [Arcobacter nitrofigilis DSM 7299]|uniref:Cl-channel voltage-gated family protein n=1 Tax=Arcobacter nitrofigilis (strain ATCC 33309 / DSM 7299 / CCUG 15893 / LMG 7604 / NCTC 12251 / CI) TaxID=572480 RepID=D5V745_ARCNC|nr:chloride channel protein [Arcobacter nitrofigilis]ADG94465.1 Cl- channel voltage-gated family protein [Arcobacter nitrofigilis DSM 7299]
MTNKNLNKHLAEQTVMFASITKWILISSLIGALVGAIVSLFLKLLEYCENSRELLPFNYYYTLPFALVLTVFLIKKFAPTAQGHGTEKVIEAVHKRSGEMDIKVIPVKLFATVLTIFAGGSVGKEGPGAQIGAAAASFIANLFKFSRRDKKKMVICGISAGFASVFGTPLAGAIFGVEILIVGALMYDILLPSIVAGFSAFFVAKMLFGISYTYFDIAFYTVFDFNYALIAKILIGGIFFGLVADFIITTMEVVEKFASNLKMNYMLKAFLGGVVIVILTMIFGTDYLGLGFETIKSALSSSFELHENVPWYAFIFKTIFTALTLGFGGSGGVITPVFYIGATSGNFFGWLVDGYIPLFAALGFVSVLAGATSAPIAAMIMAVELFGMNVAHYAALSIIIAFLMTGHRSVFPSQLLAMKKSEALDVNLGEEINNTHATYTTKFFENITKIGKLIYRKLKEQRARNKDEDL